MPDYQYELFPYANLQLGVASEDSECFDLPADHPDAGKRVLAFYFWVFPNIMFNFYPWGLSLNVVEPRTNRKTLVRFRSYTYGEKRDLQAQAAVLHQTEMEDERVVERVHLGLKSRLYKNGRFSASMEPNVHHFQRLLSRVVGV